MQLQRFSSRIDRLLGATLREHGINPAQFTVLLTIGANEGLTQQQLADAIGLTRANVSQLLDRLQEARMIERIPQGRAYALHLTDASRALLAATIPQQEQVIIDQFSSLSADSQRELSRIMAALESAGSTER